jgi:putative FmdB family regulatory protein
MPIYEYACEKCEETIEVIQKMSDPDLREHEGCGGALTKLLSMPGVHIKEGSSLPSGREHPSRLQQNENEAKAKEKKKARPIYGTPAAGRSKSK